MNSSNYLKITAEGYPLKTYSMDDASGGLITYTTEAFLR
jgi:hypothetical protein